MADSPPVACRRPGGAAEGERRRGNRSLYATSMQGSPRAAFAVLPSPAGLTLSESCLGVSCTRPAASPSSPGPLIAAWFPPLFAQEGTLDPTFGTGGLVLTDFGGGSDDRGYALAVQSNGRIVVAGTSSGNFAVARYLPSGALDPSFGTGGKATFDFGGTDQAYDVAIQADGKMVIAGDSSGAGAVLRCNDVGVLDGTFGSAGKVLLAAGTTLRTVQSTPTTPSTWLAATARGSLLAGCFRVARSTRAGMAVRGRQV